MSKQAWRFRKRSEADPFRMLKCGCKQYVYDGTVVRYCEQHNPVVKESLRTERQEDNDDAA